MPISLRADFDAQMSRSAAKRPKTGRKRAGFWLWRQSMTSDANAGGEDRRCDAANRSRLGDFVATMQVSRDFKEIRRKRLPVFMSGAESCLSSFIRKADATFPASVIEPRSR
jgi:hypothetical protein